MRNDSLGNHTMSFTYSRQTKKSSLMDGVELHINMMTYKTTSLDGFFSNDLLFLALIGFFQIDGNGWRICFNQEVKRTGIPKKVPFIVQTNMLVDFLVENIVAQMTSQPMRKQQMRNCSTHSMNISGRKALVSLHEDDSGMSSERQRFRCLS